MKKKYNILFLLLAIVAFSVALVFEKKSNVLHTEKINPQKFEQVLHSKEQRAENDLQYFKKRIIEHDYLQKNNVFFFDSLDYNSFESNNIIYLVYELDTLRFWSSNKAEFPVVYNDVFASRVNKIGSGWYEIRRTYWGNYKVLALIKLKNEYPYENRYLQNTFLPEYSLGENVNISLIPLSYGYDIKDINGDYLFSLVNSKPTLDRSDDSFWSVLLYLLSYLFLLIFLTRWLLNIKSNTVVFVFWLLVIIARVLMMVFKVPEVLYNHSFFDSGQSPFLYQSFGDFIFNILTFVFLVIIASKRLTYSKFRSKIRFKYFDAVFVFVSDLLLFGYIAAAAFMIKRFVVNTGINLKIYDILSLNFYSVLSVVFIGALFAIFFYLAYLLARAVKDYISLKVRLWATLAAFVISEAFVFMLCPDTFVIQIIAFFVLVFFDVVLQKELRSHLYFYITVIILLSFLSTYEVVSNLNLKFEKEVKASAEFLSKQRDPVAEVLLKDIYNQLQNDNLLLSYMHRELSAQTENHIAEYLRKAYFHGYWKQYSLSVYLCGENAQLLPQRQLQVCFNKFGDLINNYSTTVSEDIYFIVKPDGSTEYLIVLNNADVAVYITLSPKLLPENIGYPELLLDRNVVDKKIKFDYAKYKSNILQIKSGKYEYPKDGYKRFGVYTSDTLTEYDGYRHYVHFLDSNKNYIVVSYKKIVFFDKLITFAYIFVLFIILSSLVYLLLHLSEFRDLSAWSFRTKLILSMLIILTVAFLSLGTVTVYYNMNKFMQKFEQETKSKLHSVATAIEFAISENKINPDEVWMPYSQSSSSLEVKKQADIFQLDLNLYDKNGFLIATSRDRVYENNLIGPYINHRAFDKLVLDRIEDFTQSETIGKLKFSSSYTAIQCKDGKSVYLNIPFFANPQLLHEEISDLIVTLINLYVLLFLLTTAIALFLSEQVITPLNVLQQKLKRLELGQRYEKIDYKRKDEIGKLVEEYNKMVEKLDESIELLAKSERESAWRDMAKQIAHEIKNPLTPMKLSIQLLQRSWENKDDNFDQRLKEVTKTLIEQIETLKNIAEEFSTFAKMPQSNNEKIELAQKIENLVKLYDNLENVKVRAIIKKRPVYIWADNKHISRVFINLIKNAIQAIPDGVEGLVDIVLEAHDGKALVKIKDNGTGIPEDVQSKLFTPSFTTKSSGMGLGLAMVKNIVTNAGGKIWFETELGKGTTFFIEFPLYNGNE